MGQRDPRKVGGRYLSGYWQEEYEVTAMWTEHGTQWLTCKWAAGHSTSHCTAWDSRRDRVVSQPA